MEELATTGFIDSLWEETWLDDYYFESIRYILNEVFTEEELIELRDVELIFEIEDYLREINTSKDITVQLIKNTSSRFFYYDLNFDVEEAFADCGMWKTALNNEERQAKKIARHLRIDYKKNKEALLELVANASYGGSLCILFEAEPFDLMESETLKHNVIEFCGGSYELCVMNRANGSGHSISFNEDLKVAFTRDNLHDDEGSEGYSFSGDVCGLCKQGNAEFRFLTDGRFKKIKTNEEAEEFRLKEKHYQEVFDKGGCSAGDMNSARHRNIEYINNFPCGNKCKDCGTFWVD
jgi:hypothetical protein